MRGKSEGIERRSRETITIGTRGSPLALAQTGFVAGLIRKKFPRMIVQTRVIKTTGDKILDAPLSKIGSKGLFTKELEEALLRREIDLAVHSLKDLPSELPRGLAIGAILKRADSRDCLVSARKWTLMSIPRGSKVGTSSLRRQAQLLALRPDLKVENLRGNLDTRVRKLREGVFDAILLAAAGIARLRDPRLVAGLSVHKISRAQMLPAVGQGALAVEIRERDGAALGALRFLDHRPTRVLAQSERAFMKTLEGGCQVPVGIHSRLSGGTIVLDGLIASVSGGRCVRKNVSGPAAQAERLGSRLARELLRDGGREILGEIRT